MKKYVSLCLLISLLLIITGCSPVFKKTIVLPPCRIGEGTEHVSLGTRYTFESAFSEADAVARIKVGNWISEDTELHTTYYEATVLQCFKGEMPETFTLLQDGCSLSTLQRYPLFTYGNELLVFLNESELTGFDSPYWIIGSFTTVLDVSYDESGSRYYADRYGVLGKLANISRNYAFDPAVFSEVLASAVANDPIVEEMKYSYSYIFSEADILTLFSGL